MTAEFAVRPGQWAPTSAGRHAELGARLRARPFWSAEVALTHGPVNREAVAVSLDYCKTTVTERLTEVANLANPLWAGELGPQFDNSAARARQLAGLGAGRTAEELAAAMAYSAELAAAELAPPPELARLGDQLRALLKPGEPETPGRHRKLCRDAVALSRRIGDPRNPPDLWHTRRATSVRRERQTVVAGCQARWARLHCGCSTHLRPIPCNQREMCPTCGEHWRRKLLGKLLRATRALENMTFRARRGFRRKRVGRWAMLSLSVSSSVYNESGEVTGARSIAEQREIIVTKAWPRFRSWVQKRTGRSWPYAWVPEVTDGETGYGRHPHLHCVIMLPFIPIAEMADAWVRATDGAAGVQGFDMAKPRKSNSHDHSDNSKSLLASAKSAASYICKYATKGLECSAETAAEYSKAMFGKRRVSTSQGFWVKDKPLQCPCCGLGFVFDGIDETLAHGNAPEPKQAQAP